MPRGEVSAGADVRWTLLDRAKLADAYWQYVAPALERDGRDPETDRPSYEWLSSHGFRGLVYALREYHDRTFVEFWQEDLGLGETGDYEWATTHQPTIAAMERFLDQRQRGRSWTESTRRTHRYRLNRYVRAYAEHTGSDDLLTPVHRDADVEPTTAIDVCWATFSRLDDALDRTTLERIYRTTSAWYGWLVARRQAALNPVANLDEQYNWDADDANDRPENPALSPDHVRALYEATTSSKEQLVVIALCAWGLRSSEVAALHDDQVVLDPDDEASGGASIRFDERKNGPGTVALIYGESVYRKRRRALDSGDWSGYLFPSKRSESGHVTRGTVVRWFHRLRERSGLPDRIHGRTPVPQMGRRFWYDAYAQTMDALVSHQLEEIAEDQGSVDTRTILEEYLSPARRRELRREFMHDQLATAFEASSSP